MDPKKVAGAMGKAATHGSVELAMSGDPRRAALTGLTALMLEGVGLVGELFKRTQEGWWEAMVAAMPGAPEEAEQTVREKLRSAPGRKVVLTSIKALMDSPDDAVIPALGSLAAEYMNQDRLPDAFFRGCARALVDLTRPEMEDVRAILRATDSGAMIDVADALRVGVSDRRHNANRPQKDHVWVLPARHTARRTLELQHGLRVVTLLWMNGLAEEADVWRGENERVFTLGALDAHRLDMIFHAGAAARDP